MLPIFHSVLCSFRVWFRNHAKVQLEVVALRHQLVAIHRQNPKPKLRTADRCLWVWLSRIWSDWRSTLLIVKPETVIAWHRRGFRWYWTWKVRHGDFGRPRVPQATRELIRTISRDNPLWGAPRIHSETPEARHSYFPSLRRQAHGPTSQAAVSNVADVSRKPCRADGCSRLLNRLCLLKIPSALEQLNLRGSSFRLNGHVSDLLFPAPVAPYLVSQ